MTSKMELKAWLVKHHSLSEIKEICFDLNIDTETFSYSNKNELAMELINYLERKNRLIELVGLRTQFIQDLSIQANSSFFSLAPQLKKIIQGLAIALTIISGLITIYFVFSPTNECVENFNYQVLILDESNLQPVRNAIVQLSLTNGGFTNSQSTDSQGISILTIDCEHSKKGGRLLITNAEYESYDKIIIFDLDSLPPQIYLTPLQKQ